MNWLQPAAATERGSGRREGPRRGGGERVGPEERGVARSYLTPSVSSVSSSTFNPWVRKIPWQPTPVFLPGKFHGQRSLTGYNPWGCKTVGHDLGLNNKTATTGAAAVEEETEETDGVR